MKIKLIYLFLLLLSTSCASHNNALEYKVFTVDRDIYDMNIIMEKHTFTSKITGEDMQIDISYPPELLKQRNFPVIYMTDGHWRRIDHKYLHYLSVKKEIPPLLVVGVGYTKKYNDALIQKTRIKDFLVSPEVFLTALTREVFPRVERKFSCDVKKRILYGASLGGRFSVYAFMQSILTSKKNFHGYIGSSSYLKDLPLFDVIDGLKGKSGDGAYLYLTYGGDEDRNTFSIINDIFFKKIEEAEIKALSFMHQVNQGKNHYTNSRPTLCDGIKRILGNASSSGIELQDLDFNVFRYNFASQVQVYDWEGEDAFKNTEFSSHTGIADIAEKGSMNINADFSASDRGQIGVVFDKAIDLTGKDVTLHLNIPPTLAKLHYRLTFFVFSTFDWVIDQSKPVIIRKSGWNTFTYKWKDQKLKGNLRGVRRLGIMLHKPRQARRWKGVLSLDTVSWQ